MVVCGSGVNACVSDFHFSTVTQADSFEWICAQNPRFLVQGARGHLKDVAQQTAQVTVENPMLHALSRCWVKVDVGPRWAIIHHETAGHLTVRCCCLHRNPLSVVVCVFLQP